MEVKLTHLMPSSDEWTMIEDLVGILQPFQQATEMMCVSKYPSVSSIQPVLHKLLHTLEVKQSDSRVICATKKAIKDDLVNRYSSHDLKAFLDIATYLDPRYKELPHYHDADSYKRVEEELYRKLDSLPAEMLPNHQLG